MEPDGGWKIGFSNQKYASLEYYTIGSMISIKFVVPNWVPKTWSQLSPLRYSFPGPCYTRSYKDHSETCLAQQKLAGGNSNIFRNYHPCLGEVSHFWLKFFQLGWKDGVKSVFLYIFCQFLDEGVYKSCLVVRARVNQMAKEIEPCLHCMGTLQLLAT